MQTVSSLAKRLDLTAEEAVEKLRYMLFEVEGVESELTDEQCDILIDVDDDPAVADKVREGKLKEVEKVRKRTERLKAAAKKAAAKRKAKAAAKKKTATKKKTTAKKKTATKKKATAKKKAPDKEKAEEETEVAVEAEVVVEEAPIAEILPPEEKPAEESPEVQAPEKEVAAKEDAGKETGIIISSAIERDAQSVQVLRADGTEVEVTEVDEKDVAEAAKEPEAEAEEEKETGLLAEAEREQEEEERRKARQATRSTVKADPAVVAEVKRRAAERSKRLKAEREGPAPAAKAPRQAGFKPAFRSSPGRTGKTARKRQKKAERMRAEEAKRREAAAAVREFQAAGPKGTARSRRRRRNRAEEAAAAGMDVTQVKKVIEVDETMSVEDLANAMDVNVNEIILDLMDQDIMATKNQQLSIDIVRQLAEEDGFEVRSIIPEEEEALAEEPDKPEDLATRAPVVTVMGHVDHGKTTLLDRVRAANVAAGEAGGITQHIAAYDVPIKDGRVVFLDTPGHAAFTQMRARGAQATDVVVLVVAADDGVMPQTVEAIDHAKAAEVPIVIAVNKIDKPDAQPDRIRQELTKFDLVPEEWGGKTIVKDISALSGEGVDELMELLLLEAELLELKANPTKRARGIVVESEISKGQGPVAWVLVQSGTLRVGDVYLAGETYGRVRAMFNSRGDNVQEAGPSSPVLVVGFSQVPDAGDVFVALEDERVARGIASKRSDLTKQRQGQAVRHVTLEDFHERMLAGEKQVLNVVIKADVQGSVDVLDSSLRKLGNEEVRVEVVHSGVGGINESDVILASASDAVIIGFHVTANARVRKTAEQEGVDIRTYRVIYEAIDEVRSALEGMLAPESKEVTTGHAEIRQVFRSSAMGNIAGCYVQDGEFTRTSLIRIVRDDVVIYDGKLSSLRREKDDVKSVSSGYECGIVLEKFQDVKIGDVIESYMIESIAKTLS